MTLQIVEKENKREANGRTLALTKEVLNLNNSDRYYVKSESADIWYFVSYKFDEQNDYCTCPDSSIRRVKCKHQFAIEYSIKLETIKTVNNFNGKTFQNNIKTYEDDIYDF